MDKELVQYVKSLAVLTGIEESDIQDPYFIRRTHAVVGNTTVIVVSFNEPYEEQLPLNVVWACFDKNSLRYRKIYRRVSKDPDVLGGTQHTWELLESFTTLFDAQYYAPEDEAGAGSGLTFATVTRRGIVRLNDPASDPDNPIVVSDGDPRNTNPRNPLPHDEMHPEKPLVEMRTVTTQNVSIGTGDVEEGTVIKANSASTAVYGRLTMAELNQNGVFVAAQPLTELVAPIALIDFFYPEYDPNDLRGLFVGAQITPLAQIFTASDFVEIPTRSHVGYFTPTSIEHNGNPVVGPTVTLVEGINRIIVRVTQGVNQYSATYAIEGVL